MPNLNFGTQDGTQDGTQGNERVQLEDKLILMIRTKIYGWRRRWWQHYMT